MNNALPTVFEHPDVICTVDVVLLTLKAGILHVALVSRDSEPFEHKMALPGGFVHAQEDATAWHAAARVLGQKANLHSPYLEQLATYSGAQRDPRGWSVSIVYCALVPHEALSNREDSSSVCLLPVDQLPDLAFDHNDMVSLAVSRVRNKSQYSSLPVYFCGEQVTLPYLQAVYEAVLGERVNKVSFRRKIEELGVLEAVPGALLTGQANRPAQIYTLKKEFRRGLAFASKGLGV